MSNARLIATSLIVLLTAAILVYTVSNMTRYAWHAGRGGSHGTSVNVSWQTLVSTQSRQVEPSATQATMRWESRAASVEWGVVSSNVLERLSNVEFVSVFTPLTRAVPVLEATAPTSMPAAPRSVAASPIGVYRDVLVQGVFEPDDFLYYNGLVYAIRGDTLTLVNVTGKPSVICKVDAGNLTKALDMSVKLLLGNVSISIPVTLEPVDYARVAPLPQGGFVLLLEAVLKPEAGGAAMPSIPYMYMTLVVVYDDNCTLRHVYWVAGSLYDARVVNSAVWVVTTAAYPITASGVLPERSMLKLTRGVYTIITVLDAYKGVTTHVAVQGVTPYAFIVYPDNTTYIIGWQGVILKPLRVVKEKGRAVNIVKGEIREAIVVLRLTLNKSKLEITSANVLPGRPVKEEFAVSRYNGVLTVVVGNVKGGFTVYNLNATTLDVIGKLDVERFRERVRAVRILGTKVFIVTYRLKDPLFMIDNSDPEKPRVVGFIKSPGFDDYLRPLNPTTLLGIGYTDEPRRLRVSLYRIYEDRVEVVDRLVLDKLWYSAAVSSRHGYRDIIVVDDTLAFPAMGVKGGTQIAVVKLQPKLELRGLLPGYDVDSDGRILYTFDGKTVRAYDMESLRLKWSLGIYK